MKPVVIIGTGSFSQLLHFYLKEYSTQKVAAFSVNTQYIEEGQNALCDLPVVPFEAIESIYPPQDFNVILGVGYSKMNTVREKLFIASKSKGYVVASYIHPTAIISKDAKLGEGNIILEDCIIQPFVRVGDGNLIWYNAKIAHNNLIHNFNTIAGNVSLSGFVKIQNNCFLGNSSIIRDGVTVADNTLLGAGTYLSRDTKPYDVIVPTRSVTLEGKRSTDFL